MKISACYDIDIVTGVFIPVENFVNVPFDNGELQHGHRYLFCIYTNATSIQYELWTQELEEVAACSDGVTVDITPPEPGDVWLGQGKSHPYQVHIYKLRLTSSY